MPLCERPKRPDHCPQEIYNILMLHCWPHEPHQRARFAVLKKMMDEVSLECPVSPLPFCHVHEVTWKSGSYTCTSTLYMYRHPDTFLSESMFVLEWAVLVHVQSLCEWNLQCYIYIHDHFFVMWFTCAQESAHDCQWNWSKQWLGSK